MQESNGTDREGAFGALSAEERERLGRLGGVLFIAGSAFTIPAALFIDPAPAATSYLVGVVGLAAGTGFYLAPWRRMSSNWLHVGLGAATVQTAVAVRVLSDDFAFYYVVVAMYVAYVVRDRRAVAGYFGLLLAALLVPLTYDEHNLREQAHHILVTLPVFVIAAGFVLYLRGTLESREQRYRRFAYEAVALAIRIRGSRPRAGVDQIGRAHV